MHRFLGIIEKFCIFVPVSGKNLLIRCVMASIMENISNPSFQSSPSPAEKSGFYFCMKYSLTLNQKAVYDCGLEKSIDFIDLAILSTIKHVIGMSKIQTVFSEDKTYYWISYSHLVNELPLLGIKQDGIYRRIKKYIELGLMSANPLNSGGKTYFHITELFDNLFSDTSKKTDNIPTDENPTLRMKPRTPTDETPNPLNIIEHNTNNNKEIYKEKIIETTRTFYKTEIEQNSGHQHIEGYKQVANFIFLKNPFGKPIVGILSLENQLKFSDYLKILDKNEYNVTGILDMLANMANTPSYTKGKVSLFLTLNNWINRERKKRNKL